MEINDLFHTMGVAAALAIAWVLSIADEVDVGWFFWQLLIAGGMNLSAYVMIEHVVAKTRRGALWRVVAPFCVVLCIVFRLPLAGLCVALFAGFVLGGGMESFAGRRRSTTGFMASRTNRHH